MEIRRAFVVACLCMLAGISVSPATPLEEEFVLLPGWVPGVPGDIDGDIIKSEHGVWHGFQFDLPDDGIPGNDVQGREFLEFHREFLAYTDDYRLFAKGVAGATPFPTVVPVVALPGSTLRFEHAGFGCPRPISDTVERADACHVAAAWTARTANLMFLDPTFLGYSVHDLGVNIQTFHNEGHGTIGTHRPVDMQWQKPATRDGAFFQWHKNIDNIYSDWAIGKYQLADRSGRPIFFSVRSGAVGAPGSALNARSQSAEYQGFLPPVAGQYGASSRIGSDIYVGDGAKVVTAAAYDNSNLLYAAGVHKWNAPAEGWDIDAWSILNPAQNPVNRWYFSVTGDSTGAAGTAVNTEVNKGGDVYDSTGNNSNSLCLNESELGLAPTDELDAIEIDRERRVQGTNDSNSPGVYDRPKQWFSLRLGTTRGVKAFPIAGGAAVDVDPNDILQFYDDADNNDSDADPDDGELVIAVSHTLLGLLADGVGADDDLDALAIVDADSSTTLNTGDRIYYSLARNSPALGAGSAADIKCYVMGGGACAGVNADKLGLNGATDDLDAIDADRRACTAAGGSAISPLADPPLPGACCHAQGPGPNCTEVLATDCLAPGDTFRGEETVCATAGCPSFTGACCFPAGNCASMTDQACLQAAGTFRGPGTSCPPVPACPAAPSNDECVNALVIPYTFTSGFEPPADNTNATIPAYFSPRDPPYSCKDPRSFSGPYGAGTLWYSYTVPPGGGRSIVLSTDRAAQFYPLGGGAGDTRMAMYFAPSGNCSTLQEVACADNNIPANEEPATTNPVNYYASLRYNNPQPGRYYILLSTTYNTQRGQTYLTVTDPAVPTTTYSVPPRIPAVTTWGIVLMTLVLLAAGAALLRLR